MLGPVTVQRRREWRITPFGTKALERFREVRNLLSRPEG